MVQFKQISNTNKVIEDKVNYFIDRFLHMNTFAGYDYRLEIENHHSLVEKIYFNLTNGTLPASDIHRTYFTHELFQSLEFWEQYPVFQKVNEFFKQYLAATKQKQKESITTNIDFIEAIKELRQDLLEDESEYLYKAMWSHMRCQYPLNEHEHIAKIDLISRLMVSEAYFSGMTFTDIHEAVNRIFRKDKMNRFPFPKEIKTRKQEKEFLMAGTLDNQLSGFKRTMERNNEKNMVLMKIFGDSLFPEDIFFVYDGVTILGSEHPKILKLRQTTDDKKYFKKYLAAGEHCYILAQISYFSIDSIKNLMYQRVQKQLEYLSAIAKCQVEIDPNGGFISLSPRWKIKAYSLPLNTQKKILTPDVLRDLKNNPYQLLSKFEESAAQQWFLKHESSFVEAHRKNSISGYWKYLEALLPLDSDGKKHVKSTVSQLLIINESLNVKQRVVGTFYETLNFFNGGNDFFGIDWEDLPKVQNKLRTGIIPKEIRTSAYPFVKELLRELKHANNIDYLRKSIEYYRATLIEAYSIRNHEFHGGQANQSSLIKLVRTMPRIVQRFRWILMDGIKEMPRLDFSQLIEHLKDKSQSMLN